jgi:hypothetical protein
MAGMHSIHGYVFAAGLFFLGRADGRERILRRVWAPVGEILAIELIRWGGRHE